MKMKFWSQSPNVKKRGGFIYLNTISCSIIIVNISIVGFIIILGQFYYTLTSGACGSDFFHILNIAFIISNLKNSLEGFLLVFRILSVLIYSSIFFFLSVLPFLSAFPFRCFIFLPIKLSRIAKYAEFLTLTVCQIFLNCSCYFHLNTNGAKAQCNTWPYQREISSAVSHAWDIN